jgi:RimJ/RimL family protein N-acetyltransferase
METTLAAGTNSAGRYDRPVVRPDYPIRTARLLLRPYSIDDLDALHDIQSRPEVTRYLLFDARDRDEVRAALEERIEAGRPGHQGGPLLLALAVVLPQTEAVIGDAVLFLQSREHRQGEIGYIFHPDHGGRGYATEAARAMLRLGFEAYGLHRIVGRIDARNEPSARVLERLGMRREAHYRQNEIVKGEWTDEVVYAVLEDEWRSRPG